jgi:hypothetical protein
MMETMVARGQATTEKMAYMYKKRGSLQNNYSAEFLKNLLLMKTESFQMKFYKVSNQNIFKEN